MEFFVLRCQYGTDIYEIQALQVEKWPVRSCIQKKIKNDTQNDTRKQKRNIS